MNNVNKYINVTNDGHSFIIKLEEHKPSTAQTTLTELQKLVDSKKIVINATECSLSELTCKIIINFEMKFTWWQKIIDNILGCFISTQRTKIYEMGRDIIAKENPAPRNNPTPRNNLFQNDDFFNQSMDSINQSANDFFQYANQSNLSGNSNQIGNQINQATLSVQNNGQKSVPGVPPKLEFFPMQSLPEPKFEKPDCRELFSNAIGKFKSLRDEIVNNKELSVEEQCYLTLANVEIEKLEKKLETLDENDPKQVLLLFHNLFPGIFSSGIQSHLVALERSLFPKQNSEKRKKTEFYNENFCEFKIKNITPMIYPHAINSSDFQEYLELARECDYQTMCYLLFRKGQEYFEQAKYSKALKSIHEYMVDYSNSTLHLMVNIAIAYFQQGKYQKAKEVLKLISSFKFTIELDLAIDPKIKDNILNNSAVNSVIKQIENYQPSKSEIKSDNLRNKLKQTQKDLKKLESDIQALAFDPNIEVTLNTIIKETDTLKKANEEFAQALLNFEAKPSKENLAKIDIMVVPNKVAANNLKIKENESMMLNIKTDIENYKKLIEERNKLQLKIAGIQQNLNQLKA